MPTEQIELLNIVCNMAASKTAHIYNFLELDMLLKKYFFVKTVLRCLE